MFKALRIMQVAALGLLAAGCSTTRTAGLTAPGQPAPTAGIVAISAPPVINAGSSTNTTEGFVDAAGNLKPPVQAYARAVASSRDIPLQQVDAILQDAQYNPTVARLVTPRKTRIRRSWVTYRNRFVDPIRIKTGVRFWTEQKSILDKISADYGVPASIIVAIIGVETVYGRQTGGFRTLDALATLGFRNPDIDRPERSKMFRNQLADLIQLDHENKLDARTVTGSYAGAIGLPQFMPESLIRFAVDGDHDGVVDVRASSADAIASVANYLRQHGWIPGLPVFAPVVLPANAGELVDGGLAPTLRWAQLAAAGAKIRPRTSLAYARWKGYPLGVVDLLDEPRHLNEYRTGTPNFFAITQYNHSYFYAASVADLAEALASRMGYGWPDAVDG